MKVVFLASLGSPLSFDANIVAQAYRDFGVSVCLLSDLIICSMSGWVARYKGWPKQA